jgi:hypothetical protein
LSDIELRFVERRLSEERLALAILQFMSPSNSSKENDHPARWNSADNQSCPTLLARLGRHAF